MGLLLLDFPLAMASPSVSTNILKDRLQASIKSKAKKKVVNSTEPVRNSGSSSDMDIEDTDIHNTTLDDTGRK